MSIKNPQLKTALEKVLGVKVDKPKITLEAGFLEGVTYSDGMSVPMVASLNEFGTYNIPPRPFFRNAINKNSDKWGKIFLQGMQKQNAKNAFGLLGERIRKDIVQSINDTNEPPNSPVTIARKGSSKPLVDTGLMRASVNYRIKE